MHLPDTVLIDNPAGVGLVAAGAVLAAAGLAHGSRGMSTSETGRAGMVTAFVFVASAVHVPVPPATSVHLGLYGLAGVLLGRRVLLISPIAFGLQALLFGHGGIAAIGLNSVNMSLGALLALGWFRCIRGHRKDPGKGRMATAAFGAGFIGILGMSALTLAELLAVDYPMVITALAPVYLGTGVVEGVVTVLVLGTLAGRFPELMTAASGNRQEK